MADLNAHEAGNGGQMPREAYSPTESPLLGETSANEIHMFLGRLESVGTYDDFVPVRKAPDAEGLFPDLGRLG